MTTPQKLSVGDKHLMRVCAKGVGADGWAPVSKPVYPLLTELQSLGLIALERVGDDGRGRAQLTEKGQSILDAMAWL